MNEPTYSPGRPERNGWILGLTVPQAAITVAVVMPLVVLVGAGSTRRALLLAPAAALTLVAVLVPVRGRPAVRWCTDAARHTWGRWTGWSAWQSAVAAGLPTARDEPDLPGALSRVELRAGPWMPEHGRVCVLHDTAEGRWGATARLSARGAGLASVLECQALAAGLGRMLRGLVDSERVDRASLLVRLVPDDGTAHELWRAHHEVPDAPALAREVTAELRTMAGAVSVRQEAFLTVSGRDEVLRRAAAAAGGGADGRARTLYRALAALTEPLQAMGVDDPAWLDSAALGEAIRTGFNPGAAARLAHRRLDTGDPGLPMAAAGPSRAHPPAARAYTHDGWTTVSYAVIPPRSGVRFGSLAPLLCVAAPGERRSLAIHYEVLPSRTAARLATRDRQTTTLVSELRATRGFGSAARDAQDRGSSHRQEDAIAAGEGLVRYALVVAVTVPTDADVEDHAEALETAAAGQYHLQRLELAQDHGFIAAALPFGIGLERMRSIL